MIMSNETERTLHELKLPGMASCWSSLEETAASGTAQVVSAANSYHREGDTNITQNFYNGHDTAAAQQREARWEADKAKARKR